MSDKFRSEEWRRVIAEQLAQHHQDTHTVIEKEVKLSHPAMYEVLLLNDDYTPFEFVIEVVRNFFHKSTSEASSLTMEVHSKGQAICGIFTRDVAETKVMQVCDFARKNSYPLKCIMQKSNQHAIKKS